MVKRCSKQKTEMDRSELSHSNYIHGNAPNGKKLDHHCTGWPGTQGLEDNLLP